MRWIKRCQYVVYRFDSGEKVNVEDPSHIVAITRDTFYKLPYQDGKKKYRYVVTALDRIHNESKSVQQEDKVVNFITIAIKKKELKNG